jgi:hypothetical protein
MGYAGLVPGSVWIWRPVASTVVDAFRTLITEFESGAEQRRAKWAKPRAAVTFKFERGSLTQDDVADIWRFYKTQQGAFRTFDLPTFGRITTVESRYPGSGTLLGVADSQDFTSQATSRWNKIWVENAAGDYEVFVITSVVNTTTLQVRSGSLQGRVFEVSNPIVPVMKARFAQDIFSPEYLVALMTTMGIEFTEVRS